MQGFRFDSSSQRWTKRQGQPKNASPTIVAGPLRCATLNVLHDRALHGILFHDIRYKTICEELQSLDAHVIGLNEVTPTFLERLLGYDWVREKYSVTVVCDHPDCTDLAAAHGQSGFGNILLSRIHPVSVEYIPCPGRQREFHVVSLCLTPEAGVKPIIVAVASVHFKAFPWINESQRKFELGALATELTASGRNFDACIAMGDFNFHRESENSSIPHGWHEIPKVVELGPTWQAGPNPMIPKMLPSYNIYNGFGTGWGWSNCLRLDRVLVHGAGLNLNTVDARLFANCPVYRGEIKSHNSGEKDLPWKEYLYPSDHFGITFDISLSCQK